MDCVVHGVVKSRTGLSDFHSLDSWELGVLEKYAGPFIFYIIFFIL